MSGRRSKRKGARGERRMAAFLNWVLGRKIFRRGRQYCGGPESPDVTAINPEFNVFHIEVKVGQRINVYDALMQATRDASPNQVPLAIIQYDRKPPFFVHWGEHTVRGHDAWGKLLECEPEQIDPPDGLVRCDA